jgi:hypothetical protein
MRVDKINRRIGISCAARGSRGFLIQRDDERDIPVNFLV